MSDKLRKDIQTLATYDKSPLVKPTTVEVRTPSGELIIGTGASNLPPLKPTTGDKISERAARERLHGRSITILAPTTGELQVKCCHGNTVEECDGTCTDVTRCTPPKDQQPTTGKWTWQNVRDIMRSTHDAVYDTVAKAHNAALAVNDHKWNLARLTDIKEVTDKHAKQLAAEREKWDKLADEPLTHALRKADIEIQQLRSQLAAAQAAIKKFNDSPSWRHIKSSTAALDAATKESYEKGRQDERNKPAPQVEQGK